MQPVASRAAFAKSELIVSSWKKAGVVLQPLSSCTGGNRTDGASRTAATVRELYFPEAVVAFELNVMAAPLLWKSISLIAGTPLLSSCSTI